MSVDRAGLEGSLSELSGRQESRVLWKALAHASASVPLSGCLLLEHTVIISPAL